MAEQKYNLAEMADSLKRMLKMDSGQGSQHDGGGNGHTSGPISQQAKEPLISNSLNPESLSVSSNLVGPVSQQDERQLTVSNVNPNNFFPPGSSVGPISQQKKTNVKSAHTPLSSGLSTESVSEKKKSPPTVSSGNSSAAQPIATVQESPSPKKNKKKKKNKKQEEQAICINVTLSEPDNRAIGGQELHVVQSQQEEQSDPNVPADFGVKSLPVSASKTIQELREEYANQLEPKKKKKKKKKAKKGDEESLPCVDIGKGSSVEENPVEKVDESNEKEETVEEEYEMDKDEGLEQDKTINKAKEKYLDEVVSTATLVQLSKDKVFPLKKKSTKFPNAKYFCRLCEYHCDTVAWCLHHIKDTRHNRKKEIMQQQEKLKTIPAPSPEHLSALDNMLEELHAKHGLSDSDLLMRQEVKKELQTFLQDKIADISLRVYGSSLSGLGLKSSDLNMDLVVQDKASAAKGLASTYRILRDQEAYENVRSDFSSKVPSVKFCHTATGVDCQITVLSEWAYYTSLLLLHYARMDTRVRKLHTVFRYWGQICHVDCQEEGSLPAHTFGLMTVYYLQQTTPPVLPVVWKESMKNDPLSTLTEMTEMGNDSVKATDWTSSNNESVGSLWLGLLRFYSLQFDMSYAVISVKQLKVLPRAEKKWNTRRIAIEDPFSPKRNAARCVANTRIFEYIYECLRKACLYFGYPSKYERKVRVRTVSGQVKSEQVHCKGDNSKEKETSAVSTEKSGSFVDKESRLQELTGSTDSATSDGGIKENQFFSDCKRQVYVQEGSCDLKINVSFSSDSSSSSPVKDKDKESIHGQNKSPDKTVPACFKVDDCSSQADVQDQSVDVPESEKHTHKHSEQSDDTQVESAKDTSDHCDDQILRQDKVVSPVTSDNILSSKEKHVAEESECRTESRIITNTPEKRKNNDIDFSDDSDSDRESNIEDRTLEVEGNQSLEKEEETRKPRKVSGGSSFKVTFLGAEYNYSFTVDKLTDGKGPGIICSICDKEGHLKMSCPEESLPDLEPLPKMHKSDIQQLSAAIKQVPKDFRLSSKEIQERDQIRWDLELFLRDKFPDVVLTLFGSSCNGFGFHGSDLDICVTFKGKETAEGLDCVDIIESMSKVLKYHRDLYNIFPITTAKVPIVKFMHRPSKLEADISLYNMLAQHNTRLLETYSLIDPRVKTLGYVVKVFAKVCDIGDASKGSLSSYAYILMLLHYLQQCKPPVIPVLQQLHEANKKRPEVIVDGFNAWFFKDIDRLADVWPEYGKNNQNVGELWSDFFRYYMEEFNFVEQVVSIKQIEPLTKFEKMWNGKCIAIEDPFDLNHNLGAGLSRKMNKYILTTFIHARSLYGSPVHVNTTPETIQDYYFDSERLTEGRPPNDRNCRVCNKIGHIAKECPRLLARKEREAEGKKKREEKKARERELEANTNNKGRQPPSRTLSEGHNLAGLQQQQGRGHPHRQHSYPPEERHVHNQVQYNQPIHNLLTMNFENRNFQQQRMVGMERGSPARDFPMFQNKVNNYGSAQQQQQFRNNNYGSSPPQYRNPPGYGMSPAQFNNQYYNNSARQQGRQNQHGSPDRPHGGQNYGFPTSPHSANQMYNDQGYGYGRPGSARQEKGMNSHPGQPRRQNSCPNSGVRR